MSAYKFFSPGAPNFDGSCERLLGMSKRIFFKNAGFRILQQDNCSTPTCQVEALLNSRPLTSVSGDIRDVDSLAPGHFLTGMTSGLPSNTTISSKE